MPTLMTNNNNMHQSASALPQMYQGVFPNQWHPMTNQLTNMGYPATHAQTDVNNRRVDVLEQNVNKILEILSRNAQNSDANKGTNGINNEEQLNYVPKGITGDNIAHSTANYVPPPSMQYENVSEEEGEFIEAFNDKEKNENEVPIDEDAFEKAFSSEKFWAPVDKSVADLVNKACTEQPSEDFYKSLMDRYDKPENCNKVVAPELEKRFFCASSTSIPGSREVNLLEKKLYAAQDVLVHALYANIKLLDMLKSLKTDDPECEVTKELYEVAQGATFLTGQEWN